MRIFWVNPIIKLSLRRLTIKGQENLPKDGAIIIGPDIEHGGIERTIIAYYKYYR